MSPASAGSGPGEDVRINWMILAIASALSLSVSAQPKPSDPIGTEEAKPTSTIPDINSTGCGYVISEPDRVSMMKEGFTFSDSNNLGPNFFSKMTYVYPDKMYAKVGTDVWRIVYLGQPAIYKDYVGRNFTCSFAYGYSVVGTGKLTFVQAGTISFLENYTPPKKP